MADDDERSDFLSTITVASIITKEHRMLRDTMAEGESLYSLFDTTELSSL